jgi:hypothetical protein
MLIDADVLDEDDASLPTASTISSAAAWASWAVAGPLDEAKARAHLDAVAAGDLEALMRDYADDAYMEWVGGPLDGRYRGKAEIRAVWQKFIAVNGGKPRPANFGKLSAFANPRRAPRCSSAPTTAASCRSRSGTR